MKKIIEIKYGSHLYGTNSENSDLDIKGVYIPESSDIVLGKVKPTIQKKRHKAHGERNTKDDVDVEYLSLCRYLKLLSEGQTMALDMLFATEDCYYPLDNGDHSHEIWRSILDNKEKLLHKNVNAFVGYARQQAAKYGIKGSRMDALKQVCALFDELVELGYKYTRLEQDHIRPKLEKLVCELKESVSLEKRPLVEIIMIKSANKSTDQPHLSVCGRKVPLTATTKHAHQIFNRILNEYGARSTQAHLDGGKDWKALSHAVRVNSEAVELLKTGHITMPRPDAELLKQIKKGQVPYEEVSGMIERGLVDLIEAQKSSSLRDHVDQEWVDNFLYDVYTSVVMENACTKKLRK